MAFTDIEQIPLDQQIALSTASAKNQMAFQERMSNTAVQRQVADMKAAGINPVLAAKYGGASTPTGAEGDYGVEQQLLNILSQSVTTNAQAVNSILGSGSGRGRSNGNTTLPNSVDELFGLGNTDSDGNWTPPAWMSAFLKGQKIYVPGLGYITNLDKIVPPILSAAVNSGKDLAKMDWNPNEEGTQNFNTAVQYWLEKGRKAISAKVNSVRDNADYYKYNRKREKMNDEDNNWIVVKPKTRHVSVSAPGTKTRRIVTHGTGKVITRAGSPTRSAGVNTHALGG